MDDASHWDEPADGDDLPQPPAKPLSKRQLNRIAAMQFIYAWEVSPEEDLAARLYQFFNHLEHPREYFAFAEELAAGTIEHLGRIDDAIREHAQNWTFSRIAKVDLAVLRLAIYELLYRLDIPPVVSINEAIEMAKTYSTLDSRRFVNGILDRLKDKLDRPLRRPAI